MNWEVIKGITAKIHVNQSATAKILQNQKGSIVEEEIERLLDEGVLSQTQHSEWAMQIIPVVKSNGSTSICGDYKITVNYQLPRINDLVRSLAVIYPFSKWCSCHNSYESCRK